VAEPPAGATAAAATTGSSAAALWRLHGDDRAEQRERIEGRALRLIGAMLLVLAAVVGWQAVDALRQREVAAASPVGILLATLSLLTMPLLGRAKRRVAEGLNSGALAAEATQTSLCAWLSGVLLGGLLLNAALGWWWADPVAALVMTPLIAREGINGLQGRNPCGDACAHGLDHAHTHRHAPPAAAGARAVPHPR